MIMALRSIDDALSWLGVISSGDVSQLCAVFSRAASEMTSQSLKTALFSFQRTKFSGFKKQQFGISQGFWRSSDKHEKEKVQGDSTTVIIDYRSNPHL